MIRTALSLAALIVAVTFSQALAEPVPLTTAHGKVEKASKDSLVFQPRDESGKFGKSVSLQVTGTTKVWLLSSRSGKDKKGIVLVQKDGEAKELEAGQLIAVIYATPKGAGAGAAQRCGAAGEVGHESHSERPGAHLGHWWRCACHARHLPGP